MTGRQIDFGRRTLVLRTRTGSFSGRLEVRTGLVCAALALTGILVALVSLGAGDFALSLPDVLTALVGRGSPAAQMVVLEWRLPRVLLALLLGAALGVSGAIFQSLTRNPLGSPDIIGFNTGAYTGALVVILLAGGGYYLTALGALCGGIATAALVYLFAFRGGAHGFRLIIVGIAVSAVLASVNSWLIIKAELDDAIVAAVWGAGSLNGTSFEQALPVAGLLAVLLPVIVLLAPRLRTLELGDDAAAALGLSPERTRLVFILLGVAVTALVTAAAGPIAFVSLAAPQLARFVTRSASVAIVPSALMGAVLLAGSDLLAQRLFAPTQLPVGIVTVCVGGCYLVWLLARNTR